MKNIKIITVYGSYNHGSFLQAKCLYEALGAYGSVSFIDKNARKWNYFKTPFMRIKHNLRVNVKHPLRNIKTVLFEYTEAAKSKINWRKLPSSSQTDCDVCVMGSDEIWNINRPDCRIPFFFGDGVAAKKIAYAPSVNNASKEDFRKYPDKFELGLAYADALCGAGEYAKSLKVLSGLEVMPKEGARRGHQIYRKACLGKARKELEEGKFNAGIKSGEASKLWDERLGVGKPYDELIDYSEEEAIMKAARERNRTAFK